MGSKEIFVCFKLLPRCHHSLLHQPQADPLKPSPYVCSIVVYFNFFYVEQTLLMIWGQVYKTNTYLFFILTVTVNMQKNSAMVLSTVLQDMVWKQYFIQNDFIFQHLMFLFPLCLKSQLCIFKCFISVTLIFYTGNELVAWLEAKHLLLVNLLNVHNNEKY